MLVKNADTQVSFLEILIQSIWSEEEKLYHK